MNIGKIIGDIVSSGAGGLIETVSKSVDKFVQTKEEKDSVRVEITKIVNEHAEKMLAHATELTKSEDEAVTGRWQADMSSDNKLSKSTRPIVMLSLLGFLYLIIFSDSIPSIGFEVKETYIDLLQILLTTTVVAYFGSRGFEKVQSMKKK